MTILLAMYLGAGTLYVALDVGPRHHWIKWVKPTAAEIHNPHAPWEYTTMTKK